MNAIELKTKIPGPRSLALSARRREAVPRGAANLTPLYLESASGALVTDVDGNRLIDFAGGIGCVNLGHCDPEVTRAIATQSAKHVHGCFHVLPSEPYVALAEALNALAPVPKPARTLLVNSGAEAVENAVKIARAATGRPAVIVFTDAFHGRSLLALTMTSKVSPYKVGFGPFAPEVYRIPYAYCYRCPIGLTYPECGLDCAELLTRAFANVVEAARVACVVIEPVLGEGGFVAPPRGYLARLREITREHGILLVADEIQTGIGRTGAMYALDHEGIEADLVTTAKSVGSGLPIAAVTGRAEIMDAVAPGGLGGTYGGNPVAAAAALATLARAKELDLPARARHIGVKIRAAFDRFHARFKIVGDVRATGAMAALELVTDRETKLPNKAAAQSVCAAAIEKGLVLISAGTGGNVIRILVPLVIDDATLDEGLAVLESALAGVSSPSIRTNA